MYSQRRCNSVALLIVLCFICGCEVGPPTSYSSSLPYTGFSHHIQVAKGNTNIPDGYKEPPALDPNDVWSKIKFSREASEYLKGIKSDLEEIQAKADNATEQAEAVSDMINFGNSIPRYVGSVHLLSRQSNFKSLLGYHEFPYFDYSKPSPPLTIGRDEFRYRMYKHDLADYAATINSYLEDAAHYPERTKRLCYGQKERRRVYYLLANSI